MLLGGGDFIIFSGPILTTIAWILILLSFLGPSTINGRALMTLTPNPNSYLPKVTFGFKGSCDWANGTTTCSGILSGNYNPGISFDEITKELLKPPNFVHIAFIGVSFSFAVIAAVIWVKPIDWVQIRYVQLEDGTGQGAGQGPAPEDINSARKIVNFLVRAPLPLAFGTGVPSFLSAYMYFHKACEDFNNFHKNVDFFATTSNGFIYAWVGYGLLYSSMMVTWMYAYSYHGRAKVNQVQVQGQPDPEYFGVQPVSVVYCAGEIFTWFGEFLAAVREAREARDPPPPGQ